jgi:hypothetical protein
MGAGEIRAKAAFVVPENDVSGEIAHYKRGSFVKVVAVSDLLGQTAMELMLQNAILNSNASTAE